MDLARALLAVGEVGLVARGCCAGSAGAEAGKFAYEPMGVDVGWGDRVSLGAGGQRACNRPGPPEERDCDGVALDDDDDVDDPPPVRSRGDAGGGPPAPLNRRRTGAMSCVH